MEDPVDALSSAALDSTPRLPGIHSPPPEAVLDSVPSTEDVVRHAKTAAEIVAGQPTVDELLGRNR